MKSYRIYLGALFVAIAVLLFQNCSQVQFSSENASLGLKNENNGGGYSGKPSGEFYRFEPGFQCEGQGTYVEHISVGASVLRTQNKKLACAKIIETLDEKFIDTSIFQKEVIGYQEGIYEGKSDKPSSIPANLVEVWCRDRKDEAGIETLTHFDRTTQLAVNRVYYSVQGTGGWQNKFLADTPVARVLGEKTIHVSNGKDFDLIVFRDQPAPETGLFEANLKATIEGSEQQRKTYCRVGGSLDVNQWPVKQVVDMNVVSLKFSPDLTSFAITSDTLAPSTSRNSLYSSNFDGTRQIRLSDAIGLSDSRFHFSEDSKKIAFLEEDSNPSTARLYSANSDGSSKVQLANDLSSAATFKIAADSRTVVYNSGEIFGSWLKTLPLSGGLPFQFSPIAIAPATKPTSVQTLFSHRFELSPKRNRIAFLCCHPTIDLFTSYMDGLPPLKITPRLPAGYVPYGVRFHSNESQDLLEVHAWTDANLGAPKYINMAVKFDGTGSVEMPVGWMWQETSPSGETGVIESQSNSKARALISLQSKAQIALPELKPYSGFFSKDSATYIGLRRSSTSGALETIAISVQNGAITELCPRVPSVGVYEAQPNTFVVLAGKPGDSTLKVYVTSKSQPCREVNSLPIKIQEGSSFAAKFSKEATKLGLLSQLIQADGSREADQLFFVPLNGMPAIKVNSPVHSKAAIRSFDFVSDSKAISFLGDQVKPGVFNIYLWKLP